MSLIVFGGGKGSPGVTTAVLALAAVWPEPAVVAECDPAGGDLVYRVRGQSGAALRREPGVVSLAAATRHGTGSSMSAERLGEYCQPAAGGISLLRGPVSAEQATGLRPYWTPIARFLAQEPDTVLADAGRLHPDNAAMPVVRAADLVVLVCRDSVEGLAHLRDRCEYLLPVLAADGPASRIAVVVIANPRSGHGERAVRHAAEILAHIDVPAAAVGWLAVDPRAVRAVSAGARPLRSPLFRTGRTLADRLLPLLPGEPRATLTGLTSDEVRQ